jgi:transposase
MSTGKGSGRTRRKFTPEFKAEVVAMVDASGGKIAQVAREMRLHDSSVGNWVREAREAKAGTAPTAAERVEIRELRAELERVTREPDILGKAVDGRCRPPVWMKSLVGRLVPSTSLGA